MPSEIKPVIVILWEQEVRLAAKAFVELRRIISDPESSEEDKDSAACTALLAAEAALAGIRDEAALVLSSVPTLFHRAKEEQKG